MPQTCVLILRSSFHRRLLLFPDGNNNKNDMAALYLDYPEALFTPVHMSPKAKFELRMINQLDPSKTIVKGQQQHGSFNTLDRDRRTC